MKKLFLIIIMCVFVGCGGEKTLTINNHSTTQIIKFNIRIGYGTNEYEIKPTAQKIINMLEIHNHNMVSYQSYPVLNSVDLTQNGDIYIFYDITPVPASIYNTLVKDVILSGDGAISTDPLTISAGQEIKTATIKSKAPSFSAQTTDGYPVQVDYNFTGAAYNIILR
jgi:hypothetical protein